MRGTDHDAALRDLRDVGERPLAHEEAVHRVVGVTLARAEHVRQMGLRIEVDAQRPLPALRDRSEQVEGGRGLADAALLVEHRDDRHVVRGRGSHICGPAATPIIRMRCAAGGCRIMRVSGVRRLLGAA